MVVIKKDGSRQSFDRNKVLRGIQRSCEKRPVSAADMERMASEIEQELQNSLEREVSTDGHRRKGHGEAEKRPTRWPMSGSPRCTASSRISTPS